VTSMASVERLARGIGFPKITVKQANTIENEN
jgi:hypothetical protein